MGTVMTDFERPQVQQGRQILPLKKLSFSITLKDTTQWKVYITQTNYMPFLSISPKLFRLSQGGKIKDSSSQQNFHCKAHLTASPLF